MMTVSEATGAAMSDDPNLNQKGKVIAAFCFSPRSLFQTAGTATSEKTKQIAFPVSTLELLRLKGACEREVTTLRLLRRYLPKPHACVLIVAEVGNVESLISIPHVSEPFAGQHVPLRLLALDASF
jgi:hypothetical protein